MTYRVLDLFSGIGGFSLGLERTGGFKTVAFCEIDPFCRKVLNKHWPNVPIYEDVRTLTAERLSADGIGVDVICGGFPCQDISVAGKGAGIEGERSGLWSEYARIIGELRPRYVIVENVAALLGRGLDKVLGDLAALGFSSVWHCIPASAVGAPHRRDRLWLIVVRNDYGSCEIIRRNPELQDLWQAISATGGRSEEEEQGKVLLDRMQQCGSLLSADSGCCGLVAALHGREKNHQGDCRDLRQHLEARQSITQGAWCEVTDGTRGERPQAIPNLPNHRPNDYWSETDVGRSSPSHQRQLEGQPSEKPCRCIEEAAFGFAQAIGGYLSAAIHGGPHHVRSGERIPDDAETAGGDVDGNESIPASAVGAPHRRDRLWLVAYPESHGMEGGWPIGEQITRLPVGEKLSGCDGARSGAGHWFAEPAVDRLANGVPSRVDRLRSLGNAVVPQIPEIIGRAILQAEAA